MRFLMQRKFTVIPLLLYWPGIFILMHISLPREILENIHTSDKILHFLTYLILIFLLWFAISPHRKVNWRKAVVWWVLFVVVWYGVVDEWLQGYVGRYPDVMDFVADLAGALTGLILLTVFPFKPAFLALTAVVIIVLPNYVLANSPERLNVISAVFYLFAYAFFTLLWAQCIQKLLSVKNSRYKWLKVTLVLPVGFLLCVELFTSVTVDVFRPSRVIISLIGITAVVVTIYLMTLFRRRFSKNVNLGRLKRRV